MIHTFSNFETQLAIVTIISDDRLFDYCLRQVKNTPRWWTKGQALKDAVIMSSHLEYGWYKFLRVAGIEEKEAYLIRWEEVARTLLEYNKEKNR